MSESKHTPIPYFVSVNDDNVDIVIRACEDQEYEPIICNCSVDSANLEDEMSTDAANAEFIVRACNSHDALLAACKAAHTMLLQTNWNGDDSMNIVGAAIALAQKEG
jgi:hypothetical protein